MSNPPVSREARLGHVAGIDLDRFFGRMNAPTAAAFVRGICGDEMEFWLDIDRDAIIREVRVHVSGCETSRACAAVAASLVEGNSVRAALKLSAGAILDKLPRHYDEPEHCAVLAIMTLYRAIGDYLLQP